MSKIRIFIIDGHKVLSAFLAFCLLLTMVVIPTPVVAAETEEEGYTLDLNDYADQWVHAESDGVGYWSLDLVYCANPVDPEVQHMIIYAPEVYMEENANGTVSINSDGSVTSTSGMIYNAATAPILYTNNSGGYSSCTTQDVTIDYIKQGYVQVSVGTRGKGTQDADGKYIGQFPAIIVDLKAGIRFMKANSDIMPGCTDRITSRGASSGGAVVAMLGASGNSPIFDSYLDEIGAANATDDIFIALSSCPITNLSSADAAYEWFQHANTTYFLYNNMAYDKNGNQVIPSDQVGRNYFHTLGDNALGGAHEDELSDLLYDWFVDYVQNLDFDLGNDGRSGTFYTGVVDLYSEALTEYVARYDELKTETMPATAEEYLASLKNGESWFTWDAGTQTATVVGLDEMMYNFVDRGKMAPSLDSYNYRSNENGAFVDENGISAHFSSTVRDMLKLLIDETDDYGWSEEELAYIESLYADYEAEVTDESAAMLEIMSPINYIVSDDSYWESDTAPYWRFRVGSNDGDHGFPAAWLTANGLWEHTDAEVDIGISWNMGHGAAELTSQDLFNYIDGVVEASEVEPEWENPYTDIEEGEWYYDAVKYASMNGIMIGTAANTFSPQSSMTRAMLPTVLHRVQGTPAVTGTAPFDDVQSGLWYSNAILWANQNGIVIGYGNGMFGINDVLTREQMVTMMYRYAQYAGRSVSERESLSKFTDSSEISAYAYEAMSWAYASGLVEGRTETTLVPKGNITRCEVAAIIQRYNETPTA